jgi:hypothetical protein
VENPQPQDKKRKTAKEEQQNEKIPYSGTDAGTHHGTGRLRYR